MHAYTRPAFLQGRRPQSNASVPPELTIGLPRREGGAWRADVYKDKGGVVEFLEAGASVDTVDEVGTVQTFHYLM